MEGSRESVIRLLEGYYELACNAWVMMLARLWDLGDITRGYWVGDETGGVFAFNEELMLNMRDIRYAVKNDVSFDQACDWQDYSSWIAEYEECGYRVPTLQEYVEARVPLLGDEARQRIDAKRKEIEEMQDELGRLCDEELEKARQAFQEEG